LLTDERRVNPPWVGIAQRRFATVLEQDLVTAGTGDDVVAEGEAWQGGVPRRRLLQEAGDSLMMKPGEAANRLSRLDVLAPDGSSGHSPSRTATSSSISTTRSTALTWLTLSRDLPAWKVSL
jgi:hypothetical protein